MLLLQKLLCIKDCTSGSTVDDVLPLILFGDSIDGPSCKESLVSEEIVDNAMRLCNAYVVRGEKSVDEATVFMAGDMMEAESGGNISSTACTPSPCGLKAVVAGKPGAGLKTGDGGLE